MADSRTELYACLTTRGDGLFELCEAVLCAARRAGTLVDLALDPDHGALSGSQPRSAPPLPVPPQRTAVLSSDLAKTWRPLKVRWCFNVTPWMEE